MTIGVVQWKQVCKLGRELPEVTIGVRFQTPALEVRGKSFARLKEDGENIVFLLESVDEQKALCEAKSSVYWISSQYRGQPAVMARLAALTEPECRTRLERAWRLKAPKELHLQLERDAPIKPRSSKAKPAKPEPPKARPAKPR